MAAPRLHQDWMDAVLGVAEAILCSGSWAPGVTDRLTWRWVDADLQMEALHGIVHPASGASIHPYRAFHGALQGTTYRKERISACLWAKPRQAKPGHERSSQRKSGFLVPQPELDASPTT